MIGHVIKIALGIGLLEVDRGRQRLIAQRQHTDAGLSVLALRDQTRSEEHTSELQSRLHLVCRLLLEKKIWAAKLSKNFRFKRTATLCSTQHTHELRHHQAIRPCACASAGERSSRSCRIGYVKESARRQSPGGLEPE